MNKEIKTDRDEDGFYSSEFSIKDILAFIIGMSIVFGVYFLVVWLS